MNTVRLTEGLFAKRSLHQNDENTCITIHRGIKKAAAVFFRSLFFEMPLLMGKFVSNKIIAKREEIRENKLKKEWKEGAEKYLAAITKANEEYIARLSPDSPLKKSTPISNNKSTMTQVAPEHADDQFEELSAHAESTQEALPLNMDLLDGSVLLVNISVYLVIATTLIVCLTAGISITALFIAYGWILAVPALVLALVTYISCQVKIHQITDAAKNISIATQPVPVTESEEDARRIAVAEAQSGYSIEQQNGDYVFYDDEFNYAEENVIEPDAIATNIREITQKPANDIAQKAANDNNEFPSWM